MSAVSFDTTIRHPYLDEGFPWDAFRSVIQGLKASSFMLRSALLDDTVQIDAETAQGVYKVFDAQLLMLAGVYEDLARRDVEWSEKRRAVQDRMNGVSEAAKKLRHDFIASSNKAGADADTIGAAINVPPDDIERVLRQLRGDQGAHSGAQGGKAVGIARRASAQA